MAFQDDYQVSNESANPSLDQLLENLSRRRVLTGGLGAAGLLFLGCDGDLQSQSLDDPGIELSGQPLIGFAGVPISTDDTVVVPEGYVAEVLYAWGDPDHRDGAGLQARRQQQRRRAGSSRPACTTTACTSSRCATVAAARSRGLLVMNHEYTDDGLLHAGGMTPWTADKVRKSQAAHGVSVIEVELATGKLEGRAALAATRAASRPHADAHLRARPPATRCMRTAADPSGTRSWARSTTAPTATRPGAPTSPARRT